MPYPVIGVDAPDSIALGRKIETEFGITNKICYPFDQHVIVMGGNGKGKTTGLLMPNLLQMQNRSIVVLDVKGELAAMSADYRRTVSKVAIINPYGMFEQRPDYADLKSGGFNALSDIDPRSSDFNARCSLRASAMVQVQSEGNGKHFDMSARSLVAAVIMWVVLESYGLVKPWPVGTFEKGNPPSVRRVRELLCQPSEEAHAGNGRKARGIPALAEAMMMTDYAGLRNKAAQFQKLTPEISGVISTAQIQTESFDDEPIAADMDKNGFDFRCIKREPWTVYIMLDPDYIERQTKWLRLVITAALQAVMRDRLPGEPRVLFMLDEAYAGLGNLEIISNVWARTRGYGVSLMPVYQGLGQLKECYPKLWGSHLAQAGAVAWFGPNDSETADYMSERIGDTTRTAQSVSSSDSYSRGTNSGWTHGAEGAGSMSGGLSENFSRSRNSNESPVKVRRMTPHQLYGMGQGAMILTLDGLQHVIPAYAVPYFRIKQCAARAKANPYHMAKAAELPSITTAPGRSRALAS